MASSIEPAHRRRLCELFLPIVFLCACSTTFSGRPEPTNDEEAELKTLASKFSSDAYSACNTKKTAGCRSDIALAHMRAIDIRYKQFTNRLFRQTREAGFGATLATLGLNTAGALTNGSSHVFSAAAGLITGGRESFDKEILAQKSTLAILSAMRARRADAAARIQTGLKLPLSDYSLAYLQADLAEYEHAADLDVALSDVNQIVGGVAKSAEAEARKVVRVRLDPNGVKIRIAMCGADETCEKPNDAVLARYKDCAKKFKLPPERQDEVLYETEFETERQLLVNCMGL